MTDAYGAERRTRYAPLLCVLTGDQEWVRTPRRASNRSPMSHD